MCCQGEFGSQLDEIREAWEEEKAGHQSRAQLLQQEVEELQQAVEAGNQTRRKYKDLKRAHSKLQQDRKQVWGLSLSALLNQIITSW